MLYPDTFIFKKYFRVGVATIIQVLLFPFLVRAHGVVFTVDRLTDNYTFNGEGSGTTGDLRYCIRQANLHNDYVFFTFGLSGTIYLNAPLPLITINESVYGTNANVTISGQNLYPVFTVNQGAFASFTDLIIVDGYQPAGSGGGAAILNSGDIVVTNCTFQGHVSNSNGGAIVNNSGGKLQLYNCTFIDNISAGFGGAIQNDTGNVIIDGCLFDRDSSIAGGGAVSDNGEMILTNSTFIENASDGGGAAYQTGHDTASHYIANCTFYANGARTSGYRPAIANYAALLLVNNTLYNNNGGGVYNENPATLTLINTIVVYNGANNYNVQGTFTGLSQHNILSAAMNTNLNNNENGNIISNSVTGTLFTTSIPDLNQSFILTLALSDDSPAINAGVGSVNGINIPTSDQRGFTRIGLPDVGAYENIKQIQTILFLNAENKAYGDLPFAVVATATSGLVVNYTISGPGVMTDNMITITGVGVLTVTATQLGDVNFKATTDTLFINVSKATQTITGITAFPGIVYTGIPVLLTLTGDADSGLPVVFNIIGPAFLQDNQITITATGVVTVTAFQSGNDNYSPANPVTTIFNVNKSGQTITGTGFSTLPGTIIFVPSGLFNTTLDGITTSGLLVSYRIQTNPITGVATIEGNNLSFSGISGIVTVTAFQDGNENYLPADLSFSIFAINKTGQTITGFNSIPGLMITVPGTYNITLGGVATSGLPLGYQIQTEPDDIATITGNILSVSNPGVVTVTAFQQGNETYLYAETVSHTFNINLYETLTGINLEETRKLILFPNPGSGLFYINGNLENVILTFKISDLSGKEVYNGIIHNHMTLDLTSLSRGFYFICLMEGEKIYLEKLIIE